MLHSAQKIETVYYFAKYLFDDEDLIPKRFPFLSSDWVENLSTAQIAPTSICPKKIG